MGCLEVEDGFGFGERGGAPPLYASKNGSGSFGSTLEGGSLSGKDSRERGWLSDSGCVGRTDSKEWVGEGFGMVPSGGL